MALSTERKIGASSRAPFEIPHDTTYLNCANMAPQLRAITEAGRNAVQAKEAPWKLHAPDCFSGAETLRFLAAQILDTEAAGVALVPAVSYGIAIAAANLPVTPGQSLVVLDQEFPSNVYGWRRKTAHGSRPSGVKPVSPGQVRCSARYARTQ